jgi:hypothetical protein
LWTAAAGLHNAHRVLHNAHRVGATISPSVKAAYLYQPGASMWSYNVAGSRSWAPVAGAPRPAAPTGSPIGAELYEGNHSIPRSPRAPPVEVWAGVFKSGGGGGAGGGGFRLDDCLRELGLGTGTAGARSASSGVASQRPAAKRFDESWAATCARRRRQQGHREVQVSSAGCLGTLDFVSPSPSPSPRLDARRSTLDARRSPPLPRLMLLALMPSRHTLMPCPHTLTPSRPHTLMPHPRTLALAAHPLSTPLAGSAVLRTH